jgi:hypothetical protein
MPGTVEQREQAARELRMKNMKDVMELPVELRIAGKPVKIFNVGPFRHQRSMGSYGQWTVHPCEPGTVWIVEIDDSVEPPIVEWTSRACTEKEIAYSKPTEVPYITNDPVHIDMQQMAHRHDSGRKLALDILGVGQFHTPAEDLTKWGVFVAEGDIPTKKELHDARKKLMAMYADLIQEADAYWNQGPQAYGNISDMHRLAARELNQTNKPWARAVAEAEKCPICASPHDPAAAICPICRTVIDEAKVIKMKVPGYEYLWENAGKKS